MGSAGMNPNIVIPDSRLKHFRLFSETEEFLTNPWDYLSEKNAEFIE